MFLPYNFANNNNNNNNKGNTKANTRPPEIFLLYNFASTVLSTDTFLCHHGSYLSYTWIERYYLTLNVIKAIKATFGQNKVFSTPVPSCFLFHGVWHNAKKPRFGKKILKVDIAWTPSWTTQKILGFEFHNIFKCSNMPVIVAHANADMTAFTPDSCTDTSSLRQACASL